jgi:sulfatase modifying factor 1
MTWRTSSLCTLLIGLAWLGACTTDFGGYHLRAEADGGADGAGDSGGRSSMSSAGNTASNGGDAGGSDAVAGATSSGGSSAAVAGAGGDLGNDAAGSASGGAPSVPAPSCAGLPDDCGAEQSASCCKSSLVPGGTYARSAQAGDHTSVSAFRLDDYEVTVGRFRNFVHAFSHDMIAEGSGKNPRNAADPGWDAGYSSKLPANATTLATTVRCANGTFSPTASDGENQPMTCVSWYEAFAFCIWDGGRLPTEAEWNYAAAGGAEERKYPWGDSAPTDSQAVFCPGSCSTFQNVGSKSAGVGKWGQVDLVGNAWEWTLDVFAKPYAQASCSDCAYTDAAASTRRAFRGGSAGNDASYLLVADRNSRESTDHNGFIGLRCARDP